MTEPAEKLPAAFSQLIPSLREAVAAQGFKTPTPIQEQAIPALLEGRDLIGCAQTGTGKTCAFLLPALQRLVRNPRPLKPGRPRLLILAPTRELALQIGHQTGIFSRTTGLRHLVLCGGTPIQSQIEELKTKPEIVVATPGRLIDLLINRHIRLSAVEMFVLDEADRMLDLGFLHDVRRIIKRLPEVRQSMFFSATINTQIMKLARTLVHDPVRIDIEPEKPTVGTIRQKVFFTEEKNKDNLLKELLTADKTGRVIIFVRTRQNASRLGKQLIAGDFTATVLHSDKSQQNRNRALENFRSGRARILVATDIAARGIDIENVTHVINYDLPDDPETYIHRIGRTARAGAEGDAFSFCCAEERELLRRIEALIGYPVPDESRHAYHSEEAKNAPASAARRGYQQKNQPQRRKTDLIPGADGRALRKKSKRWRSPKSKSRWGNVK